MIFTTKPGWVGHWVAEDAPGAFPIGTRVEKISSEQGDAHAPGARATVIGSIHDPDLGTCYFVEWDNAPKHAVAVVAWKIARIQ